MLALSRQNLLLQALFLLIGLSCLAWFFSDIVIYLVCSLVLATLLRPVVNALHRLKLFSYSMHRSLAVLFSFLLTIAILWAVFSLFILLITEQITILTSLDYEAVLRSLETPLKHTEKIFIQLHITDQPPGFLSDLIGAHLFSFFKDVEIASLLNEIAGFTGGLFTALISIAVVTFMLLYEDQGLYRSFIAFIPNRYFEVIISWLFLLESRFVNYLGGLFIQMGIVFVMSTIGLLIIGVTYAPTIGLFAALANLIPYLGPILGTLFAIVVSLSAYGMDMFSYEAITLMIQIGSVFLFVQLIDNFVIQPMVFSRSLKAHPIEILVIIFVGANLSGILGMVLAIPLYTIIKISIIEAYKGLSEYRGLRR